MVEVVKVEDLGLGKHIGDYDIDIYDAIIIPKGTTKNCRLSGLSRWNRRMYRL